MFESLKHHIPKRIGEEKETSFAVLIPLIKKEDGYHVLFEVRAKHLNKQPGEVCFPGGKVEPGESTYEAAVCSGVWSAPRIKRGTHPPF